jgi:hypothetical protein
MSYNGRKQANSPRRNAMRRIIAFLFIGVLIAVAGMGCESTGNPFTGSQWDVGANHLSFSHAVAEWDTANNQMILKFDLLSGSSYPTAEVTVKGVTTLSVGDTRDADVHVAISQGVEYECIAGDADVNATVTFTRLDLNPLGGVSGHITGMARRIGDPSEPLATLTGDFSDVIVTN